MRGFLDTLGLLAALALPLSVPDTARSQGTAGPEMREAGFPVDAVAVAAALLGQGRWSDAHGILGPAARRRPARRRPAVRGGHGRDGALSTPRAPGGGARRPAGGLGDSVQGHLGDRSR